MDLDPGTYIIQNVMHQSIATQLREKRVVADADTTSDQTYGLRLEMLWRISHLNNGKFTIKNFLTNDYAASTTFPLKSDAIVAKQSRQQWVIKETGFKGRYVIYTTATLTRIDLFWGLANDELLTPITLRDIPNNPSNQWVLTKVVSRKQLEEETLQLRATLAELREENVKFRDSVDLWKNAQQETFQLRATVSELREENKKLRDSVGLWKNAQQETSQLHTTLSELQEENTKLRDSVDHRKTAQQETFQLHAALTELREENKKILDSVDRWKDTSAGAAIGAQKARKRHEAADLQLRVKLSELQEENADLRGRAHLSNAGRSVEFYSEWDRRPQSLVLAGRRESWLNPWH
ncbi:hypothetical protein BD410DRAFT_899134 [Rickenella mellea]|uniref:Uncharacterized protein n=1 Tax=Rickenella mellea TaxID=50990 RepID=A0A4Y7Q0B2_9AGAM|nr:hypothetical protein BD410DRAFT_899134 [Rickenella mellea]